MSKVLCHCRSQGFSLAELLVVIIIMGIVAGVAVPTLFSADSKKLDVAATELAEAIRFTRAEAIRTATPNGFKYFFFTPKFSVYRVVYTIISGGAIPVPTYDVRHPIDKKLYTLDYSSSGNQAPVTIGSVSFKYGGDATNRDYISFDKHGTPRYLNGPNYQMLDNANIVLEYGGHTRTINIAPMTGRITVQ